MKSLGAYMIVKDEAEMITRCLSSLTGIDELVILDTGSTDDTVSICQKFTDKVLTHYKWNSNFAEARNESLKHLTTDWALVIDADEVMQEGGISKLKNFLNSGSAHKYDAISIPVITMAEDGNQPRVHKRIDEIYWERPAHNILVHDQDKEYSLDVKIYSDFSPAHNNDPIRTIKILTEAISKDPSDLRNYFYMGREFMFKGDVGSAMYFFLKYIDKCPIELTSNELADCYFSLAECYYYFGDRAKAAYCCGSALVAYPGFEPAVKMLIELNGDDDRKIPWQAMLKAADNTKALFSRKMKLV
jgi:glycosyltransferase involved in cell wall biosynthesis